METRSITADIPEEHFDRLKRYKERRCLTWAGLLVIASERLPDQEEPPSIPR